MNLFDDTDTPDVVRAAQIVAAALQSGLETIAVAIAGKELASPLGEAFAALNDLADEIGHCAEALESIAVSLAIGIPSRPVETDGETVGDSVDELIK
jgi:hypothetical protein